MKTLVLVSLIFLLPCLSFAQSKADYDQVMSKIMKYYNKKDMAKFRRLFVDPSELDKNGKWDIVEFHKSLGKIKSYKQTLVHEGRVTFESTITGPKGDTLAKGQDVTLTSFSLNKENKVYNFSLIGGYR